MDYFRKPVLIASLILLGNGLVGIPGFGQPAATQPTTTTPQPVQPASIAVAKCTEPPKIDGVLDDPCWKSATHAPIFYRYRGTSPVAEQTEAWICADNDHLYIAFHCLDDHPNLIKAAETVRNGNLNSDDFVQVIIDSQNTRRNGTYFTVNARGTQEDYLEGGTADNIAWAGDWKAATKRTADGWNCEISVPFALLRYPRNANEMGIIFQRKLARETSMECWPYMAYDLQKHTIQYMTAFTALTPTTYPPRPIFLPYVLATAGEGYSSRFGIDAKYPINNSFTALATVNPDFQDVQEAVTNINFSYEAKQYQDFRPFFAEGAAFFPASDVFYSNAIGQIDEGFKVTGKDGGTTLGVLGTSTHESGGESDAAGYISQEMGAYSSVHFSFADDTRYGSPSTGVIKPEFVYGVPMGDTRYFVNANYEPSWSDNNPVNAKDYVSLHSDAPPGKPQFYIEHQDIGSTFADNIAYIPQLGIRETSGRVFQFNRFDTGSLDRYYVFLSAEDYDDFNGGFFHKAASLSTYLDYRPGTAVYLSTTDQQWLGNHDFINEAAYYWGNRTRYAPGSIDESVGSQDSQRYNYISANQGYALSRFVTLNGNVNQLLLGNSVTTQTVITGAYELTYERSIALRYVGEGHSSNVFLSYGQKSRNGSDIFVLFGNPNSPQTQGMITVKVIVPFT